MVLSRREEEDVERGQHLADFTNESREVSQSGVERNELSGIRTSARAGVPDTLSTFDYSQSSNLKTDASLGPGSDRVPSLQHSHIAVQSAQGHMPHPPSGGNSFSRIKNTFHGTGAATSSSHPAVDDLGMGMGSYPATSFRSSFSGMPRTLGSKVHPPLLFETDHAGSVDTGSFDPVPERKPPSRFWGKDPLPGEVDIGQELGDHAAIWQKYCEGAQEHDKTMVQGWNGDMDVLLVFAALFSGILTAFIIEFYRQLQPDDQNTSIALLMNMAVALQCVANGTICTNIPHLPALQFEASQSAKWINGLWFTSLTLSLSVSATSILVKQWIHAYKSGLTGLPKTYACIRQFRYNGVKKWHMSGIISALPTVMYLAVLLFFAGLLVLLWSLDTAIYTACVAVLVVTGIAYTVSTVLPVIDPSCPFRTPTSHFLDSMYHVVMFYIIRLWHLCIYGVLTVLYPLWNRFTWSSHALVQKVMRLLFKRYVNIKWLLDQRLHVKPQAEREQENIFSQIPKLNAHALVWLSNNVQDTQELVVQGIAGLDCQLAAEQFLVLFNGLHWPSRSLLDTSNNPSIMSSAYHHKLASCAQAYMITAQADSNWDLNTHSTQIICNALQWYSVLIPMGQQTGPPDISASFLRQALSELGQALSIVTDTVTIENQSFQIVVHLLLQSILTLYVLYSENSIVQSRIIETCLETLQIWMREQEVLEQWPRPYFLQALCTIVQVFAGLTQPEALRGIWHGEKQKERTWMLLLTGLVSTSGKHRESNWVLLLNGVISVSPSNQQRYSDSETLEFEQWKLLHHTLIECNNLLLRDRPVLESVLDVFLNTSATMKELWSTEEQDHPFQCLNVISHLLMPQDTLAIFQSFKTPWSNQSGPRICRLLQIQCESLEHAKAVASSEVLLWLLKYFRASNDFSSLWAICVMLETLSKVSSPALLDLVVQDQILQSVNIMLHQEIQKDAIRQWTYNQWGAIHSLVTSCKHLYRTFKGHVISSGILITLHQLSIFASTSEYAEMKETQNFMHAVLRLMEHASGLYQ